MVLSTQQHTDSSFSSIQFVAQSSIQLETVIFKINRNNIFGDIHTPKNTYLDMSVTNMKFLCTHSTLQQHKHFEMVCLCQES